MTLCHFIERNPSLCLLKAAVCQNVRVVRAPCVEGERKMRTGKAR